MYPLYGALFAGDRSGYLEGRSVFKMDGEVDGVDDCMIANLCFFYMLLGLRYIRYVILL